VADREEGEEEVEEEVAEEFVAVDEDLRVILTDRAGVEELNRKIWSLLACRMD
jgi:hypothetical protein